MARTRIEVFIDIEDSPQMHITAEVTRDAHQESLMTLRVNPDRIRDGEAIADRIVDMLETIVARTFENVADGSMGKRPDFPA